MSEKLVQAYIRLSTKEKEFNKAARNLPEYRRLQRAKKIVEELKKSCTHPENHLRDYSWHHGYGKYINGWYCTLCKKYRAWKTMGNWDKERPGMNFED